MSRKGDLDKLLRQARRDGLHVEPHGAGWRVTNGTAGGQVFLPAHSTGRGLHNVRSELRRLAAPGPMTAAVIGHDIEETPVAMPIDELLDLAARQGVRVELRGGLLHVSGPVEAETLARCVRDRGDQVIAHLTPATPLEDTMPRVGDIAHIAHPAPVKDVAADAYQVWQQMRALAAEQGNQTGNNAGVPGVMWRGALTRVVKDFWPSWGDDRRREVSGYLERSGNAKCQSRNARPPVWWLRAAWDDGGLTVTQTPERADTPAARPAPPRGPAVPVLPPDVSDPLTLLTAVAKRVSDAEQRAADAEELLAEALAENEQLRAERDAYRAKVEEISSAFRVLAGGSQ